MKPPVRNEAKQQILSCSQDQPYDQEPNVRLAPESRALPNKQHSAYHGHESESVGMYVEPEAKQIARQSIHGVEIE